VVAVTCRGADATSFHQAQSCVLRCRDTKQRISGQGFKLDISLLFDGDLSSGLTPSDLPPSLLAACVNM
jgi:hypothetical protein